MTKRCTMRRVTMSLAIAMMAVAYALDIRVSADDCVLFTAKNLQPEVLPTLGLWEEYSQRKKQFDRFVSATFPNVPDFTCDLWCYESEGITFVDGRPLEKGRVELRHSWDGHNWDIISTVTPLAGALDVVARLVPIESEKSDHPSEYPPLNICWQLRRAADFASKPEPYPEFVKRCFIFTDHGRTYLHDTERRPIPVRSRDEKENNPPWVQMYLPESAPADIRADANSWAGYSPDRYTLPIIGAVSRDGNYLAAIATGAEGMVCQAWHDCLHNNARWLPAAETADKTWRVRIYVMENDSEALIARFLREFPSVVPWQ